jgi:hypothetical protein
MGSCYHNTAGSRLLRSDGDHKPDSEKCLFKVDCLISKASSTVLEDFAKGFGELGIGFLDFLQN